MTGAATPRQRPRTWPDVLIAMALGAIALAVYNATLTPSHRNERGAWRHL
jgi:hypothetical protein